MIRTVAIRRWRDVLKLDVEWPMDLYRGQANAEWPLQTAIHRALSRSNMLEGAANTEYWMLRDFRRGASRYLSKHPEDADYVGWLSLMQHHGAATRLLDFTHSFYVACYFALIDAAGDSAVWAVDPDFLLRVMERAFDVECRGLRDEWEDLSTNKANQYLAELLATASSSEPEVVKCGVVQVHPFTLHTRLSAQQGLFLMPLDVELDFLSNLAAFRRRGRFPIKKVILKREMREDALAHLREMNITAETLFPGIDGFARSILHRQRVF
jgi:FRG domain